MGCCPHRNRNDLTVYLTVIEHREEGLLYFMERTATCL